MSQPFSRERREHALSRAESVGDAAAAEEAGVTVKTLERWRTRAEARAVADEGERVDGELMAGELVVPNVEPASSSEDAGDLEAQLRRTAQAARRTAESAIARLEAALPTSRNVQSIAVSIGVLIDKARLLDDILQESEERQGRLAEAQAQVVAALLEAFCEALGVDGAPSLRSVMRGLLEQASAGEIMVVSPADSEALRAEVRGRLLAGVSAFEMAAIKLEQPALPESTGEAR